MPDPVPVQQSVKCETCGMPDMLSERDDEIPHKELHGHEFKPIAPSQSVEEARENVLSELRTEPNPVNVKRAVDALIEAVRRERDGDHHLRSALEKLSAFDVQVQLESDRK